MRPSHLLVHPSRVVGAGLLALGLVLCGAGSAHAHVSIDPARATKGSFSVLSFSVPNERADASTVKLEVIFPVDHPIPFVSVRPLPGWTWAVERTTLKRPIDAERERVTEATSRITWTGGEIKPGEFQLFTISAGPLPKNTKRLEFKAVQTYSNGQVVRWIEPKPKGGPEPEFPAPVLVLTGKTGSH